MPIHIKVSGAYLTLLDNRVSINSEMMTVVGRTPLCTLHYSHRLRIYVRRQWSKKKILTHPFRTSSKLQSPPLLCRYVFRDIVAAYYAWHFRTFCQEDSVYVVMNTARANCINSLIADESKRMRLEQSVTGDWCFCRSSKRGNFNWRRNWFALYGVKKILVSGCGIFKLAEWIICGTKFLHIHNYSWISRWYFFQTSCFRTTRGILNGRFTGDILEIGKKSKSSFFF